MKKLFILIVILFAGNMLKAQSNTSPSAKVIKQVEILKNADLYLTDVQISRITTVLAGVEQNSIKMLKAVEGNKSLTELRLKEIKEHNISNVKGAMTPQQVEKFEILKLEDKF